MAEGIAPQFEDDDPLIDADQIQAGYRGELQNDARVKRRHGRTRGREQRVSEALYGDDVQSEAYTKSMDQEVKKMHHRQSRRLPPWVWYIIAKSLGIKVHELDKPWFGTLMHILTMLFALAFISSFIWYTVYDIVNIYTKQTVLTGLCAITITIYWCSLGIYGNKLASKLFASQNFVDSVRLHSKTIFKVSAAGLLIILTMTITVVNNYSSSLTFSNDHCKNITLSTAVCKVMFASRVGFSIFSGIWNLLVGIVLLSVCRTHTIGIRRFIRELEQDGKLYELFYRKTMIRQRDGDESDTEEEYLWDDNDISPTSPGYHFPTHPTLSQLSSLTQSLPTTPTRHLSHRTNSLSSPRPSPPKSQSQPTSASHHHQGDGEAAATQQQPSFPFPPPGGAAELDQIAVAPSSSQRGTTTSSSNGNHNNKAVPPQQQQQQVPLQPKPLIIVKADSLCIQEEDVESVRSSELRDKMGIDGCVVRDDSTWLQIQQDPSSAVSRSNASQGDSPQHSLRVELNSPRKIPSSITGIDGDQDSASNYSLGPRGLTIDDILMRYWKISVRLRTTSMALQRWLVAWITFILVWSVTFLIYWVSHEATLLGIAEFFLPILILPLITAAYGEVNNEGKRMLKCICPTEERLHMLFFLMQQPLEMTAFGFSVSYSLIVTALGALGLAFCSKIMLDELNLH